MKHFKRNHSCAICQSKQQLKDIKTEPELTIFLACSSQRGVWCVMSNTGMEHCWPSANLAVQLAKSCWERFNRISTQTDEGNNSTGWIQTGKMLNIIKLHLRKDTLKAVLGEGQSSVAAGVTFGVAGASPWIWALPPRWRQTETMKKIQNFNIQSKPKKSPGRGGYWNSGSSWYWSVPVP